MPNVAVQKTNEPGGTRLPVFEEIERRFENIRQRAFELFEGRKEWLGRELDDWLQAEREVLGAPAAELAEKEGAYEIQVALPGFDAKDVEVTATPAEIVVKAAAKEETKREERGKVLWTEFGTREIYRRFTLPEATDAEKVAAKLENGILRITAPKAPAVAEPGPRKVAIAA